jgi:hypothetical protein
LSNLLTAQAQLKPSQDGMVSKTFGVVGNFENFFANLIHNEFNAVPVQTA